MSTNATDATVASIIEDLTISATLTFDEASFRLSRAIQSLRLAASNPVSVISPEQRDALDAAIRAVQPLIVGEPANLGLRIMVCALHVVTAEWAKPNRVAPPASANALEALLLARMLSNTVDNALIQNVIEQKRGEMDRAQWRWLGDLVNELYPLPTMAPPDPLPIDGRTLN